MNQITIIGNISEPKVNFTKSGKAIMTFGLATTRLVKDEKVTTWHNVKAWDGLAERLTDLVQKGDRVIVVGRIEQEQWEDKDGNKRTTVNVVADDAGLSLRFGPRDADTK